MVSASAISSVLLLIAGVTAVFFVINEKDNETVSHSFTFHACAIVH